MTEFPVIPSVETPVVPINDLKRLYASYGDKVSKAVGTTLASGWWLNGAETSAFSNEFAAYVGVSHCLGVANGTDALEIAMRALLSVGRTTGNEVVMVPNAGGYSTIAARLLGLTPVYSDIEESSQLASLASMVAAIGKDTLAVVVTHLYGNAVDVPRLRVMMKEAGHDHVSIIEDCAQAHGARVGGKRVGSLGDIATFSFYPTKNLGAFGDGGAIVSGNETLAEICRSLHQYGWTTKYTVARTGGRNSRLDEVQAAILRVLLPHLDAMNEKRREILRRYADAAPAGLSIVRGTDGGQGGVGHLAVVLANDRNGLKRHLSAMRIQSDIHYPVLDCDQPAWRDLPQHEAPDGLGVARRSVGRILTLPCFPAMTESEIDRVCEALAGWTVNSDVSS